MTMPKYLRRARVEIVHMGNLLLSVDESLRIAFSIRKGSQSDGPSSEVKIYNLSRASESLIIDRHDLVRVQAGYGDGKMLGLVGEMEIRNVMRERVGLDRVTTMTLGASDTAKTETVWSQSYEGEVLLPQIVADLLDAMGLKLGPTAIVPNVPISDFSEVGKAYDVLRDLLEPWGIEPHIEDGYVKFAWLVPTPTPSPIPVAIPTPAPGATPSRAPTPIAALSVVLLDEPGGLIGSPSATEKGARAKMLLNTALLLDQPVDIRSELLSGTFVISSIVHRGDTWSGEFVTEIEGVTFEPERATQDTVSRPAAAPTPLPGGRI